MQDRKSKIGYIFIPKNTKKISTPSISVDFEGMQDVWADGLMPNDPYEQIPVEEYNEVDSLVFGWYEKIFQSFDLENKIKKNEHNLIVFLETNREMITEELSSLGYSEDWESEKKPTIHDWFEENKHTCTVEEWYGEKEKT
jgi:hypothetical protein